MDKTKTPRKPKNLTIGSVHARPIRGPKDGRWYWQAERYADGGSSTCWTGWGTVLEVEREIAKLLATGQERAPKGKGNTKVETIKDLLEVWKASQEDRVTAGEITDRTLENYSQAMKHLDKKLGHVPFANLQRLTLEGYRNERLTDGISPRTLNLEMRVLIIAWAWGREHGLVPDKDLPRVKAVVKRNEHKNNHHTPTREDVEKVLDAMMLSAHTSRGWIRPFTMMLAYTGCRIGELSDLRWGDLDLDAEDPLVRVSGKTGPREVPLTMSDDLVPTLRAIPRGDDDRVFWPGVRSIHSGMNGASTLANACKRAKVQVFTAHGLRRFCEDTLAEEGVDIAVYCAWLGHSPAVALTHYRNIRPGALHAAATTVRLNSTGQKSWKILKLSTVR